jgi:hypothetical protein
MHITVACVFGACSWGSVTVGPFIVVYYEPPERQQHIAAEY